MPNSETTGEKGDAACRGFTHDGLSPNSSEWCFTTWRDRQFGLMFGVRVFLNFSGPQSKHVTSIVSARSG